MAVSSSTMYNRFANMRVGDPIVKLTLEPKPQVGGAKIGVGRIGGGPRPQGGKTVSASHSARPDALKAPSSVRTSPRKQSDVSVHLGILANRYMH